MHLWVKKLNLFNFTMSLSKTLHQVFIIIPQGRRKLPIPLKQHFLKILFSEQKEGGEDYVVKKIIKINKGIGRHICNLYIFGLYFVVQ